MTVHGKIYHYSMDNDEVSETVHNTLQIVESWAGEGYIYSTIDSSGVAFRFKQSQDKGKTWTNLIGTSGSIRAIWYDSANDYIYVLQYNDTMGDIILRRLNISNEDSVSSANVYIQLGSNFDAIDVFIIGSDIYLSYVFKDGTPDYQFYVDDIGDGINNENMGSATNITWDSSQMVVIGTDAYFLFRMSNGNVKIWKFDSTLGTFTDLEDCGVGTELPPIKQRAIVYDNNNLLGFILGLGTCEVSTIDCSGAFGNINNSEYLTFSALRKHGYDYYDTSREVDYALWFDVTGVADPPSTPGYTQIEVDISGAGSDQDISDLVVAAINGYGTGRFVATNAGGTSTTVTITNYYAGNVTDIADVDTGLSVATNTPGIDKDYYYYSYNISGDALTKGGIFNIALQMDRNNNSSNAAPNNIEKAFHLTDYFVYKISRNRGNVWKIADLNNADTPPTDVIIAITDKYLITNDAKLYEYVNFM